MFQCFEELLLETVYQAGYLPISKFIVDRILFNEVLVISTLKDNPKQRLVNKGETLLLGPVICLGSASTRAPASTAGNPDSNPGPEDNFYL